MSNVVYVESPRWELITPLEWIKQFPSILEICGRTCYKSEDKITDTSAEKFISNIIKSGHESVIEHCCITVRIICSRAASHQLVRHRIASFSQVSQRYCDYNKKTLSIIVPPSIGIINSGEYDLEDALNLHSFSSGLYEWLYNRYDDYCEYIKLRDKGIPPEDARFCLPNACATEVATTFNLREWRHVFKERALNKHAQWEIRSIMLSIFDSFCEWLPCIFGDIKK